MTTPKAKLAGLALIAALCAGFTLGLTACTDERARTGAETPPAEGLTAPASAAWDEGVAAYERPDYAEVVTWSRKAAEQGVAEAQYNLGFMYYNGLGVPQDYAEAVRSYRKAAEQGLALAQFNLGIMYYKGRGVPKDYVQAHMWNILAASRFPPGEDRDDAVNHRNSLAEKMTPAQLTEAEKLAREWKPK